jgi:two-component system OmpR family response regulator
MSPVAESQERRILLIEDSDVLRRRLVELLSEPGLLNVVSQAATQDEALSRLHEGPFDVLVVDIELAEGNGVAVIRQARQLFPPEAQPLIVVLTNYASDFVRDHCFAAGADYFLDKMRDIARLKPIVAAGHSKWQLPQAPH